MNITLPMISYIILVLKEPALREFSAAMRRSMLFGADSTQFGISGDDVRRDLSSPDNDIYLDMYFTWSQRLY